MRPPRSKRSQPTTVNLFVVAHCQLTLYQYMSEYFSGRPDVEVILDQRHLADRRRRREPVCPERRSKQRRLGAVDADLASLGFAAVTVRRSAS